MEVGRPLVIATPEIFDERAQAYFAECKEEKERPLLTGLILALGLSSRQSLDRYQDRPEFSDSVKKAKMKVEAGYERALAANNVSGAIFALKNFGWKDKQEIEHSGKVGITQLLDEIDGDREGLPE